MCVGYEPERFFGFGESFVTGLAEGLGAAAYTPYGELISSFKDLAIEAERAAVRANIFGDALDAQGYSFETRKLLSEMGEDLWRKLK